MPTGPSHNNRAAVNRRIELDRLERELMARLNAIRDPYALLRQLPPVHGFGAARVASAERLMRHYRHFIGLLKDWPRSDQDALLRAARAIFKVNVTTMRADLRVAQCQREPVC